MKALQDKVVAFPKTQCAEVTRSLAELFFHLGNTWFFHTVTTFLFLQKYCKLS